MDRSDDLVRERRGDGFLLGDQILLLKSLAENNHGCVHTGPAWVAPLQK